MEKIIKFVEMHIKWAEQDPKNAHINYNQAFGALQFFLIDHTDEYIKYAPLETKWNEVYRPKFEQIIYGEVL